jgi:hypothetical protein
VSRPSPVLVVGTGRCGSTLVSAMMRAHPEVLSVSELFSFVTDLGSLIPRAFAAEPVSGAAFWQVVAACHPRGNQLLRHGLRMDEVIYPFERGRFRPDAGVPAVLMTTLPHLDDDPDARFDELATAMTARAPAPMAEHYRGLFEHLGRHYGRRTWVERSGGTLRIVHRLVDAFPEARFVHLVRDGRDTAISMSRHHGFRMALVGFQLLEMLGVDPWESGDRREAGDLADDLAALLPERFTAEAFTRYDISPSLCGHYWSGEIRRGLAVLAALPAERVITLRYEDLLADPHTSVTRLGEALGLGEVDPQWRRTAVAMVASGRSAWRSLPAPERRELEDACAPGFAALAEHGLRWPEAEGSG